MIRLTLVALGAVLLVIGASGKATHPNIIWIVTGQLPHWQLIQ